MIKTQIDPGSVQELLDSAANAGRKGQAQYFTPVGPARPLAALLPAYRPILTDLTCGGGHLFHACAHETTHALLGADIDACAGRRLGEARVDSRSVTQTHRLTADLTRLYPILLDVEFRAHCFVLNPPWDLHWHRAELARLAESALPAVRAAFAAHDGRVPHACLDSSAATLMIALDRCSVFGEGLIILNAATAERLILGEGAPHGALARHVWAQVPLEGFFPVPAVALFFAAGHDSGAGAGPAGRGRVSYSLTDLVGRDSASLRIHTASPRIHRRGPELAPYLPASAEGETLPAWTAAVEGWQRLHSGAPPPFHLRLRNDGTIGTALSIYDQRVRKVDKAAAAKLHELHGQHPLQLIHQRAQRDRLLAQVEGGMWTVDPQLIEAVHAAVRDYHADRAPLYALPDMQRLGYLDEESRIECRLDMVVGPVGRDSVEPASGHASSPAIFRAGQWYPLRSETVAVTRRREKMNLVGELDEMEYTGHELAYLITDGQGGEHSFRMDADAENRNAEAENAVGRKSKTSSFPAFPLSALSTHFLIPSVPDVAVVQPARYQENLRLLRQMESLTT